MTTDVLSNASSQTEKGNPSNDVLASEEIDLEDVPSTSRESEASGKSNGPKRIRKVLHQAAVPLPVSLKYGEESNQEEANDQESNKENDDYHLQEDIYTLLFTAPVSITSHAFWYFCFFFAFQVAVIALILVDLFSEGTANNPFAVPPAVDTVVSVSQVLALFISVLTQDDVTTTLYLISVGYDENHVPPTASRTKWVVSNFLRFLLGSSIIFLCFVFIIQSENVIDLFKDFAAVTFVSEIDDVAFHLAQRGFGSDELRDATKRLEDVHFSERDDTVKLSTKGTCCKRAVAFRFRQLFLIALFGIMSGAWGRLFRRQKNGDFLTSTFQVQFGDETFDNLQYASFSGVYQIAEDKIVGGRPVYYERGEASGGTSGMFFYCPEEEAWVFAVDGVTKGNKRDDDCHWLFRSPTTNAYDLSDVSPDGWKVWTGAVDNAQNFRFFASDCSGDADCNYHGECMSDGSCNCDEGWLGSFCRFSDDICDSLVFYIDDKPVQHFHLLHDASGEQVLVYGRPVYYGNDTVTNKLMAVLHTGRRWFVTVWDGWNATKVDALVTYLSSPFFHAYWSRLYEQRTVAFTVPTERMMPVGDNIEWDVIGSSRSKGDFGPLGFWKDIQFGAMHCEYVNCDIVGVCGIAGDCQNSTCVCLDEHTGHFCQFPFLPDIAESSAATN